MQESEKKSVAVMIRLFLMIFFPHKYTIISDSPLSNQCDWPLHAEHQNVLLYGDSVYSAARSPCAFLEGILGEFIFRLP